MTPENEELVEELMCAQEEKPGSHMSPREIEKHTEMIISCQNGEEKWLESIQTSKDTEDEQRDKTKSN